jgi:hypothetical protein
MPFALCVAVGETAAARARSIFSPPPTCSTTKNQSHANRAPFSFSSEDFKRGDGKMLCKVRVLIVT